MSDILIKIENFKTITSIEVAEMMCLEHKELLRTIRTHIKNLTGGEVALSKYFIDGLYKDSTGRKLPMYDVTKRGCEYIAHKMQGVKGAIFTDKYMDRFEEMEERIKVLSHEEQLVLKLYRGGTGSIEAHKKLVGIEVQRETAKIKDGTNRLLSAQQVCELLKISKLTTTILNEWLCFEGYGEMMLFKGEKNRTFQPNQKFIDLVAYKGYSLTGTTVKGNKVRVQYSLAMVDYILDNHMRSLTDYVRLVTE